MKTIYKKTILSLSVLVMAVLFVSCSSTKDKYTDATDDDFKIEKSGAQLWGETCNRCHLAPSPADYNDTDWDTIGLHMQIRANITVDDINKIKEFLKSAN
jgi:PBP1b-binding outer membrane lipoprotein LpoB